MKLAWMFGSSLAAHHLLYAYLTVWIVQGGYCAWVAWQWKQTKPTSRPDATPASTHHDDL